MQYNLKDLEITEYLNKFKNGLHLDRKTVDHVCGKLEWYSEEVKCGRLKSKSWWNYLPDLHAGLN